MGFGGRTAEKITGETVVNDDFFPDIDLGDFQEKQRINTEYRIETIKHRILLAMIYVNRELKEQKAIWQTAGAVELAEVDDETMGEEFTLEIIYLNAVYSHAKANLMQDYATMNRREEAENEGKENSSAYDNYMADCQDAIKLLSTGEQGTLEIYNV